MSHDIRSRESFNPWLFLVGLVVFLGSALWFFANLIRGVDVLYPMVVNAIAAASLVVWAGYDTLHDPESDVDSITGSLGTALLLYGVYLLAGGLVVTVTGFFHAYLTLGLWLGAVALVLSVAGFLIFPKESFVEGKRKRALEQYEAATTACNDAGERLAADEYERAIERYNDVESAIGKAVLQDIDSADESEEAVAAETEANERVTALLSDLDEQATQAIQAGKSHIEGNEFSPATGAFKAARQALATAEDVAAATDRATIHGTDESDLDGKATVEAWIELTEELATAVGSIEAGSVVRALQALDNAEDVAIESQRDLFGRKRAEILEAALVGARTLEREGVTSDPSPRGITEWRRSCEAIMDAYGETMNAVEAGDDRLDAGDRSGAHEAFENALDSLERARVVASGAGIDTDYIDEEAERISERLEAVSEPR